MPWLADDEPLTQEELPQYRARRRRLLVVIGMAVCLLAAWVGYWSLVAHRVRDLRAACTAARDAAQWAELETLAQRWIHWQPARAMPWLFAADAAQQLGDMQRAAEYLRQVPDGDPRTPEALLQLSDLLFGSLHRPLEAAAVCERILTLDAWNIEARRRLIFIYGVTLQRRQMMLEARKAIDLGSELPETYIYLVGTDWITFSNAYELNTQWLQSDPGNELFLVSQTIHFAGMSSEEEKPGEPDPSATPRRAAQEQMLHQVFERFSQNLELLAHFLREGCTNGDVQGVAELLARAPPEAVEDNRFWRFKGWLHAATGEFGPAKAAYLQALKHNPFDWRSQYELADVLRRTRQTEDVDKWATLAVEGRALWREILELPDVQSAPPALMERIAKYARACGDNRVADCLEYRLAATK